LTKLDAECCSLNAQHGTRTSIDALPRFAALRVFLTTTRAESAG
jgi:hypothetical protein